MKLAFIGAGKMATALAGGFIGGAVFAAEDVVATDISEDARAAFADATGAGTLADNAAAVAAADVVVLAVKPQVAGSVLAPLKGRFDGKLVVSIAAGLSIARLSEWTGTNRVIRVMPNTPAMVGHGASVFARGPGATAADGDLAQRMFGAIGVACEMAEAKLDAVTGVSGSGPAYVFEFIQALIDAAVAAGLDAEDARQLVVQTVIGAATMVEQGMGTPDELRNAVTSKGGTTAAGLQVMADASFRDLMTAVVRRATERSIELGRDS